MISTSNDFYKEIILDHYRNPRNKGTIPKPSKSATLYNPLCGDKIRIDLVLRNGKVKDIKFSGKGCVISQASASLLTEYAKNKKVIYLRKVDEKSIINMLNINLGPNRLKCALLPLEVLRKICS